MVCNVDLLPPATARSKAVIALVVALTPHTYIFHYVMKLIWGYVLFELCGSGVNYEVHALSLCHEVKCGKD